MNVYTASPTFLILYFTRPIYTVTAMSATRFVIVDFKEMNE